MALRASKDIALSARIVKQYRHTHSGNRGRWLSANIYSDERNGCKSCGGKFDAVKDLEGVEYPACSGCGKAPTLFRIRAKILTEDLRVKYVDIRHDRQGKRLSKVWDCLAVLERVKDEMDKGQFNYRDYDSLDGREAYLFENYADEYLKFHSKRRDRGELSPAGFRNKEKYVRVLKPHFSGRDIVTIKIKEIDAFKNSFTDRFRTRDLALSELKAILNHAEKYNDISKAPKFDLVPASKKRKEIVSLEDALRIIDKVEDPQYQVMLKLLTVYPVRPCELRALQWRDVDYFGNTIRFERHFSEDVLLDGRKSVSSGDKAELEFPLESWFREFLLCLPRPLKKDQFIFPGKEQEFVSENCLQRAWRKARTKLKMPPYQLYEMRHARLSQIAEQSNGNIQKVMRASGHTNPKTLMERYVRDTSDLKEFFQ